MTGPTPRRRESRAPTGVIALVVTALGAVAVIVDAAVRAGGSTALLIAPWPLLAVWGVQVFVTAPHINMGEHDVRVHNVLRTFDVPWGAIEGIEMRWQLELRLVGGHVLRCWGGPTGARSSRSRGVASATERSLELIREHWEAARLRERAAGPVRRRWNVPALASFLLLTAWAVVAVAITGGP